MLQHWQTLRQRMPTLFFDGHGAQHDWGRYSYLCASPIATIQHTCPIQASGALQKLDNRLKACPHQLDPSLPPFQGGAAGLISYDYGRSVMTEPANPTPLWPCIHLHVFDTVLSYDHLTQQAWLVSRDLGMGTQQDVKTRHQTFQAWLRAPSQACGKIPTFAWHTLQSNMTPEAYRQAVRAVQAYILSGDIFQANISQQWHWPCQSHLDPAALYHHMRQQRPSPFSAYADFGDYQLLSLSPERFLRVQHDGQIEAYPIKGTCARHATPLEDNAAKQALQNNPKDRAENIMIVDLMRNDLSKICVPESVDVPDLCAVHPFCDVHHLISTVTGKKHPHVGIHALLQATLAAGSITGAPKKRAMAIIDDIEPHQRGPYCGHLCWFDGHGQFDANILIRTLMVKDNAVQFCAGGAVTLDSDPQAEYFETLLKAKSIMTTLLADPAPMAAWLRTHQPTSSMAP